MNELIKITDQNGKKIVSAKELYQYLKSSNEMKHFADWSNRNIVKMFTQNVDYQILHYGGVNSGRPGIDYAVTIDCAKELAMMSMCENGKRARQYFIACEAKLRQIVLPGTYSEALRELASTVEEKELLKQQNILMAPKAEFFDAVIVSKDTFEMSEVAKILNIGFGRNILFQNLRQLKILRDNNEPYQLYVDNGWFRCIETTYQKRDGSVGIDKKTVVFQKGMDGIRKLFLKPQMQLKF